MKRQNYIQEALGIIQAVAGVPTMNNDLAEFYVLLAMAKGKKVSLEDIHNAWSLAMNRYNPEHRSIVPYKDLPDNMKVLDKPWRELVIRISDPINLLIEGRASWKDNSLSKTLDTLASNFTDELNAGLDPDTAKYLGQCPEEG